MTFEKKKMKIVCQQCHKPFYTYLFRARLCPKCERKEQEGDS